MKRFILYLIIFLFPVSSLLAQQYHNDDVDALKAFLIQSSAETGKYNYEKLGFTAEPDWSDENWVQTVNGLTWDSNTPKRLTGISWTNKTIAGQLILTACSNLQTVRCYSNQLTEINVANLSALETLDCCSNQFTSLNLSGLIKLSYLCCLNNQLTSLDVSDSPSLAHINCSNNRIPLSQLPAILPSYQSSYTYAPQRTFEGGVIYTGKVDLSAHLRDDKTIFKWYLQNDVNKELTDILQEDSDGIFTIPSQYTGLPLICKMTNPDFPGLNTNPITYTVLYQNPEYIIDNYTVEPISDYLYTGLPIEPSITVRNPEGVELTQNVDFSIRYVNNKLVGNADVSITGTGKYSGTLEAKFNITPVTLAVKAHAQSMIYGTDPSSLVITDAYDISGFVNNETAAVLQTLPQVTIDQSITSASSAGTYTNKVLVSGAVAENYVFTYESNTLTITQNAEGGHLIFDLIPYKEYGYPTFLLEGRHTLGKPVTFESDNPDVVSIIQSGQNWVATIHKAGDATLRIKFAGDDDAEAEELPQIITVAKAPLTITAMGQIRGVGQDNPDVRSQYCISGYINASDANDFISRPEAYIDPQYDINSSQGDYKNGVLLSGGEHPNYWMKYVYGDLQIVPYDVGITFPPFCNMTYGDIPFILTAGHAGGQGVKFISLNPDIISVAEENGVWKATIHHVGTATIRAYVDNGTGGSNPGSVRDQTITVDRAPLTIRPDDKSKIYWEENPELTISFYGLQYDDTKDDFGDNINISTTAATDSDVSTYPITVSGAVNDNYIISNATGYLTINKTQLTMSLDDDDVPAIYTGYELKTTKTASVSGIKGNNANISVSYNYRKDGGTVNSFAIDAGDYTVTATTQGDKNHTSATTTAKFIVDKRIPVLTLTSVSSEYSGNPVPVNAPVITGSTTAHRLSYTARYRGTGETTYPETANPPVDYGTYEVTVSTLGDANHYSASNKTTISIGKKTPAMSMIGKTKTYDSTPLALTAGINPANLEVTYSYEGTLKDGTIYGPAADAPSEAGNYTVTASTTGDHNHSATFVTANIEITKKEASITLNNKSTSYTGEAISIEPPVTEPATALLVITYKGTGNTDYPESKQAPKNGGTYQAKAVFAGNNNYLATQATANLTITDAGSPTLTLDNKSVIYNAEPQSIGEAKVSPPSAGYLTVTYTYSNSDYPASVTPPTNAGTYTVKATTPADNNFKAGSVTASLIIEKAEQTITFPELGTKSISEVSFNAGTSVNSGLPLTYSSGNTDIAEVSADGIINMKKAGQVTITASQVGNENYLPATLSRVLNITSNDANLYVLRINGVRQDISENIYYDMECSNVDELDILLEIETNASVNTGRSFKVVSDKPMKKVIEIIVTSQDLTNTKIYTLTIEKRFKFDAIVVTRWNNTLTVINNPDNNGGYRFTSFKWFKNGVELATGQSYTAGSNHELLSAADRYYVELTGEQFEGTLRSCEGTPNLKSSTIKAYPNPADRYETVYVEADVDEELLEGAVIEVYNVSGLKNNQVKVQGRLTPVTLKNATSGTYIFKFKGKDGFSKDLKVIVK